jgi:feruloyl-CoA synthase
MSATAKARLRPVRMGSMSVDSERRADGTLILRARGDLPAYPRTIIDRLRHWAEAAPDRVFLADRGLDGAWRTVTYRETLDQVRAVAQALLAYDLSVERPIAILSGNSIEHGLLALAAMTIGVPIAPVSPAYSLVSKDHAKLRHIFDLVTPGMVFVSEGAPFAAALRAVMKPGMALVSVRAFAEGFDTVDFADLLATAPTIAVEAADARVGPDTIAKFLFTSGSTGMPKAVINTQRMLCCNQVMILGVLAFLGDEPPVLLDWLPWNHTAGGNHNFGIALFNGGSFYIDDGAPSPAGILRTVRNLEEIAPTWYSNVPKGYEMLVTHLATNRRLRETFYSRMKLLQYAGAGLSQHVWDSLEAFAADTVGERIMIITGYGSTETAPFALTTAWPVDRPGEVGLPARGLELKLVPAEEKLELRLRGPNVTPGYWRQPDKTAESFDDEGFYRIGDALKLVDPEDPGKGLLFDGRVAEDFKLSTGTWVNMASVRGAIVKAFSPYVRDAVLTGLNLDHIGALLFLDVEACRSIHTDLRGAGDAQIAAHPAVRATFQDRLDGLAAQSTGSSTLVARVVILDEPPSIDAHEITDKGSINQRAVMAARASLVEDLYREPVPDHVLIARSSRT